MASMATGSEAVSYIRDVWAETLEAEMANIRELVQHYSYVSMVSTRLALLVTSVCAEPSRLGPFFSEV